MSVITPSGLPTELTEITNGETLLTVYNPDTGQNEKTKMDTVAEFALINGVTTSDMENYAVTNNDLEVVDDDIPVFDGTTGKIVKSSGTTLTSLQSDIGSKLTGTTDQLCKAWVNFNGTGTVAIRDSFNVSSITDNGTGDYTINFINPMNDANYSISLGAGSTTTTFITIIYVDTVATGSIRTLTRNKDGVATDRDIISAQIFGS